MKEMHNKHASFQTRSCEDLHCVGFGSIAAMSGFFSNTFGIEVNDGMNSWSDINEWKGSILCEKSVSQLLFGA